MSEGGSVILGLVLGYCVVSLSESFFHRAVGHAQPEVRRAWRAMGFFGLPFRQAWYRHHVVHHRLTFRRDQEAQFSDLEEEARLRRRLTSRRHAWALGGDYGVRVGGPIAFLRFVMPTLPGFALLCWFGGGWFTAGALVALALMPLASEFVHPCTHMSSARAAREAPAWLRPLLRTRYFSFIVAHHRLHHEHPSCNFNLLPGGDWLLGCHRRAEAGGGR